MATQSEQLYTKAQHVIPAGVNSPVRAFRGVGGNPIFMQRGEGAYLIDVDGRRYVDYVDSWGPLILGHAHPAVIDATISTLKNGLSFGAPTPLEVELAETVCAMMPSIEQVRFVSSGTEATMSAIRLARGYTKRDKIIKFAGCYHGHCDSLLVQAGSGALTFGTPSSAGIPASVAEHTLVVPYNDLTAVEALFKQWGSQIAAIIVEPVAANMNCVLPLPGFLEGLRRLCEQHESVLIFDEVITGFRLGLGGAQAHYGIKPDLTTLGKIIGGGMPVGAFGGRRDIMAHIAPNGPVYQAGTLSGNPVAMAAGLATLNELRKPGFYNLLEQRTNILVDGLCSRAQEAGIALHCEQISSIFGLYFTEQTTITSLTQVNACDAERYKRFFHGMLQYGFYFAPSAFEVAFVSSAHSDKEIAATLACAEQVFATI